MMTKRRNVTAGTREWADHNVNLIDGCIHDCQYCYAKGNAARFGRRTKEDWHVMKVRWKDVAKGYRKRHGRIMFPTSHDIPPMDVCPVEFSACMIVLRKLVQAGNDVLITTKPHLENVKFMCVMLDEFKEHVQFRFTITSCHDEVLARWEPGAPVFQERVDALKVAFTRGYATSISIEPCLDVDPRPLIGAIAPFTTGTIWIGPMNHCGEHAFNEFNTLCNWERWFTGINKIKFKDAFYNKLGVCDWCGATRAMNIRKRGKDRYKVGGKKLCFSCVVKYLAGASRDK